ncbi:MAG: hypothetical protein A3H91_01360 [Gammaproteobacteria bacterium RIFCSPLOWO2_02_FULL_61_13]|nr:MAG: hypothetical protein A3H91_01360 [Gammaproteobacteria bacterium RIFCSPLOWO2_02_FULL_61_13]
MRRAWLCGEDALIGKSFEHRKPWMLARLKLLTDTFAIDLCAYALMSNHYHLVVRLGPWITGSESLKSAPTVPRCSPPASRT